MVIWQLCDCLPASSLMPELTKNQVFCGTPGMSELKLISTRTLLLLLLSSFSCVRLCATPQTAAHQAPPSMAFSRQEYWSGLPLPSLTRRLRTRYYWNATYRKQRPERSSLWADRVQTLDVLFYPWLCTRLKHAQPSTGDLVERQTLIQ